MKFRFLLLIFLGVSAGQVFAQEEIHRKLDFSISGYQAKPLYNPSGNYRQEITDSVVSMAKDSVNPLYGIGLHFSYSQNFTKRLYYKLGLHNVMYGMKTHYPPRHVGVPNIDSTFYKNRVELRTLEFSLGLTYEQEIKRSSIFVSLNLNCGFVYSGKFKVIAIDYYSTDIEGTVSTKIPEHLFLAATGNIGFRQYLGKHFDLLVGYSLSQQLNQYNKLSEYFGVKFKSQFYQMGVSCKI